MLSDAKLDDEEKFPARLKPSAVGVKVTALPA